MISVPDTDDAPDEDERESISSTTSERRTSIVLDGNTLAFENPVSLVLAAARQLGLSLRNQSHTRLLWIADEALLDEYDEDQTAEMASIPAKPLSDDVAAYYSDVFAQRSKSTVAPVLDEKQAAVIADIAAHKERARKSMSKRERRRDRQRRSLALREERLSGVSERYTEEQLDDLSSSGGSPLASPSGRVPSPHSPRAAIWPVDLSPEDLHGESSTGSGLKRSLPRIDSSSIALDQLEQQHLEQEKGAEPEAKPESIPDSPAAPAFAPLPLPSLQLPPAVSAAVAVPAAAPAVAPPFTMPPPAFALPPPAMPPATAPAFAATSHEDGIGADGIRRVQAKQSPALSRRSSGKGKDGGARFAVGDRVEVRGGAPPPCVLSSPLRTCREEEPSGLLCPPSAAIPPAAAAEPAAASLYLRWTLTTRAGSPESSSPCRAPSTK